MGDYRGVQPAANLNGFPANHDGLNEGLVTASKPRFSFENSSPSRPTDLNTSTNFSQPSSQFPSNSRDSPLSDDSRAGSQPPPVPEKATPNRMYQPTQMSNSPSSNNQSGPIGHGHNHQQSTDSTYSTASQPRLQTSPSIVRKPLPVRSTSIKTPASAETATSTGSLGHHVIDQTAFNMIGREDHTPARGAANQLYRQNTDASSVYDDDASSASPDYASTRQSVDTRKSFEKPRAGVMKTVGNTEVSGYMGNQSTSVESAKWGTYKGTLVDVSHLDLINWTNRLRWMMWQLVGNERKFNAIAFYLDIADMLSKEGL